jgi:hypothetical protein
VRVIIAGHPFQATFAQTGTKRSVHSNRDVVVGRVEFVIVDPEAQQEVADWLQSRRRLDLAGDGNSQYAVVSNTYSSVGFRGPWTHSVKVEEAEDLNPSELVIDGLAVKPELYEEHAEEGGITLATTFSVDAPGRKKVEERLERHLGRPSYFELLRVGIEDSPRNVRFGRSLWSEHGSTTKYHLFFVEKGVDDARPTHLDFYPELPTVRRQVADTRGLVDELLAALVETGALSQERREDLERRVVEARFKRTWALFNVEDVDQTWLGPR